ncbi:hypothetical protein AAF712_012578 [Marasmius tenuissimus]|uniref:Uncharacterized protein n=1 Tax=Marasmius tenuissimus TaxID=585030 RepID=A0ABR2ZHE1_9AGAR
MDVSPIRLESVRRLQVSILSTTSSTSCRKHVCHALTLPHLEDLEVVHSVDMFTGLDCLFDLIDRSECHATIKTLSISGIEMIELTVLRLLRTLPEVRRLSLNAEFLFPHLFCALATDRELLPKLSFLSVTTPLYHEDTVRALMDMMQSRRPVISGARVERLHTLHTESFDGRAAAEKPSSSQLGMTPLRIHIAEMESGFSRRPPSTDSSFHKLLSKLVRMKPEWESKIAGPRSRANMVENGYLLNYMLTVIQKRPADFQRCPQMPIPDSAALRARLTEKVRRFTLLKAISVAVAFSSPDGIR